MQENCSLNTYQLPTVPIGSNLICTIVNKATTMILRTHFTYAMNTKCAHDGKSLSHLPLAENFWLVLSHNIQALFLRK